MSKSIVVCVQMTLYLLFISIVQTQAYRHGIFVDTTPLCNNLTCKDGLQHTACRNFQPHARCKDFKILDMSRRDINTMILGHNGIRNKIAMEWDIGNMNILHWSRELERISKYFLIDCQARRDVCNFLVSKDITIGQNIFFSKASPGSRWVGRTIRHWYSELGYDIKSWKQFTEAQKSNTSLTEFTQMIWPTAEFIGCAAARMFDGYLATCYYHPAISENWNDFTHAKACTKCSRERLTCSRVFTKLCGLDVPYSSSSHLKEPNFAIWALLLNVLGLFRYFNVKF